VREPRAGRVEGEEGGGTGEKERRWGLKKGGRTCKRKGPSAKRKIGMRENYVCCSEIWVLLLNSSQLIDQLNLLVRI
jgi:hypothetical protein